ncbi:MAG TPA: response regulator [Ignavibacteria bacterium]|nr:response regulator [Ignavibacteria bacterium]
MKFIIVDDDPLNNKLCRHILKITTSGSEISDYLYPSEALDFIKSTKLETEDDASSIIFLDLNMPLISGWDFLDVFSQFDDRIKAQYKIYILSSSIDERDKERARKNPHVLQFISKPLTKDKVKAIIENQINGEK